VAVLRRVFKVLIPDNLKPVVANADPVNPTFTVGWLDYAQTRGFGTDPARVRSPKDKPRVERVVQYVRGNFFAGETFTDLVDARRRAEEWCRTTAGCGCTARPRTARRNTSPPRNKPCSCAHR
jgi:transposase